ncbi:MAG: ribonuclease G [Gammaproteobacteria bacterium]|nr:ribonuclease G [Gammaproteobacteria bacterium]
MSDEILINVTPRETRIALVENGLLQEVYVERSNRRSMVGNIYLGRVQRVLPGIQAAFIDIDHQRTAFLHVADIHVPDGEGGERSQAGAQIADLVREGDTLLVQVIKDPLGSKGARLTTQISLPSRFVVLMPNSRSTGISQRIASEQERLRLRAALEQITNGILAGYIIRTAAEGCSAAELAEDVIFLNKLWAALQQVLVGAIAPVVIHDVLPLECRMLRDIPGTGIDKVRVDSRETWKRLQEFSRQFIPDLLPRIEHYPGARPIFDLYSVDDEIQKALQRRVQLKSGGHLIIDQTEAMTTIDVNTGAFVGSRNLEETIFKTNLEASQAIARQLRLRNLGGIIIVDFIDMTDEEHKRQVLRALEKSLEKDRAKRHISGVSPLGLVEMTRERTRESLEHVLCESCPVCRGRGTLKTRETTCYEIFREILREERQFDAQQFLVLASQEVISMLLDEESTSLAELEAFIGKPVRLQVEGMYSREQFDVVMM